LPATGRFHEPLESTPNPHTFFKVIVPIVPYVITNWVTTLLTTSESQPDCHGYRVAMFSVRYDLRLKKQSIMKLVNTTCVAQPEGGTRICEVNGLLALWINKIRAIEAVGWCVDVMTSIRMTSHGYVQYHSIIYAIQAVRSVYYAIPKINAIPAVHIGGLSAVGCPSLLIQHVKFEILRTVNIKVFWIATKCSLLSTEVSERPTSVFIASHQWRTEGGLGGSTPPPPKFRRPFQNRAKLNPIVTTVKNCWI